MVGPCADLPSQQPPPCPFTACPPPAVPGTIWRYTTRRVLITEWVDGRSPSQLLAAAEAPIAMPDGSDDAAVAAAREARRAARRQVLSLVRMGVQCSLAQVRWLRWGAAMQSCDCWLRPSGGNVFNHHPACKTAGSHSSALATLPPCCPQLLVTGVMHGDPHSGNLLLRKVGAVAGCGSFPAVAAACGASVVIAERVLLPTPAFLRDHCRCQLDITAACHAAALHRSLTGIDTNNWHCRGPALPRRLTAGSATSTLGWWCA